jgi:hypothetical protein
MYSTKNQNLTRKFPGLSDQPLGSSIEVANQTTSGQTDQ